MGERTTGCELATAHEAALAKEEAWVQRDVARADRRLRRDHAAAERRRAEAD